MGPSLDYPALYWRVSARFLVCVCVCVTGMEQQCLAKGAPSAFTLPRSRSQGVLGCVSRAINFSRILEMTFGGISALSLGGVGPSLRRRDPESCHCLVCTEGICISAGALKYHHSVLPTFVLSTFLFLCFHPDWQKHNSLSPPANLINFSSTNTEDNASNSAQRPGV